ncbi:MAG: hypothetical protein K8F62_13470 [Pseudorhodoplanes sp.]|nr:hypothetical protein [Pseudorhodoplanes sp.]
MMLMTGVDVAAVFLLRKGKRQIRSLAMHALCILSGSYLFFAVAPVASAQHAALADRAATFLQDSLRQWGHFTPRDANLPNIKFYCVCGPYRNCEHEARQLAEGLGYRLPQHDYSTRDRLPTLRQKILFFFEHEQIVEIEIPYERPFYFAVEHEAFCDVNLDKRIPRTKEERGAD